MASRNWPNINLVLLEAKGSREFGYRTLTYPLLASGYLKIRCFILSGGPS